MKNEPARFLESLAKVLAQKGGHDKLIQQEPCGGRKEAR